jgi:drug/metabolite transporter (DMT)-like permease
LNTTALKIAAFTAIIAGEAIMIAQQMIIAKAGKEHSLQTPALWLLIFWSIIGVLLVLGGYYFGYLAFKNIWIVGVISVGSVLIAEVLLAVTLFGETPTLGAWIGLGFGLAGILASFLL